MAVDTMVGSVHYQEVDSGLGWVKDADVAIDSEDPLDSVRALTRNVLKMGRGYRMDYHGFGPECPSVESKGYIPSACSTDAERWEKEPGIRMDAGGEGADLHLEP